MTHNTHTSASLGPTPQRVARVLEQLGVAEHPRLTGDGPGGAIEVRSPIDEQVVARVGLDDRASLDETIERAQEAFLQWRSVPAPRRGLFVRRLADELRDKRELLGELVSLETGKIASEGVGEVQEAIDIADYAVGLSRMIGGLTLPSERPGHELQERWRPLGPVGVVTAFNFPAAVWAWNAMLAFVCGDAVVWKPSLRSPLTAVALQTIVQRCAEEMDVPAVGQLVVGTDEEAGEPLVADRRLPLISATGSCAMGRRVGEIVAKRLGRALLELGGNNAAIVLADADMELALRAVLFGAVGTAGQRCTTTRRLLVHRSVADRFVDRLAAAYRSLVVGDPMDPRTHVGPLITAEAVERMQRALALALEQGGEVVVGGAALQGPGHYVEPAIVRAPASGSLPIALEETFAPILYVFAVDSLDEAIARNNEAAQGLSSAIFTRDLRSAERFLSEVGSDCGIANVNTGTSGAEIGGAFGGEKETGGGREAGSDAWKAYMRRQTCAINCSDDLPLAQGVSFGV